MSAAAGTGGLSPLYAMTREQLEQLLEAVAERTAAKVMTGGRQQGDLPMLSNREVAELHFGGSADALHSFVYRNGEALSGCYEGDGKRRKWKADRLEQALSKIRRRDA